MIWIGESEIQNNQVKIKNMYLKTEEMVDRQDLIVKI
jgi:histidyl-tRNA synthetase